jgi:hypothetical protein
VTASAPTPPQGRHAWVTGLPGSTACCKCGAPYAAANRTNTCAEYYALLAAQVRRSAVIKLPPEFE